MVASPNARSVMEIPHTVVIAPSCADEAKSLMYQAIQQFAADHAAGRDGNSYLFFVGRENYPLTWIAGAKYPRGKAQILSTGSDVVLIGCGVLVNKASEAGKLLAAKSVHIRSIRLPGGGALCEARPGRAQDG